MPQKSHTTTNVSTPRQPRSVVQDLLLVPKSYYSNLPELAGRLQGLKSLTSWVILKTENCVVLKKFSEDIQTDIPYISIEIDDGLGFTIKVFGWLLPENHSIYLSSKRSMKNITVSLCQF